MSQTDVAPRRILITGANGFVGRHLIAHLLSDGAFAKSRLLAGVHSASEARVPDRSPSAGWNGDDLEGRVEALPLDLGDAEATRRVVLEAQPDAIVHLAARASGADANRDAILAVNVEGTRRLLDAAAELRPFPLALVVSTGYVYGDTPRERPARESDPIGPLWRYGAYTDSKIEMENVAKNYRGFTLIARPFAHTGPGQPAFYATPSFARQLATIERGDAPPTLHVGNLDALRDLLDVRDVVRAYALLLRFGQQGAVYNIANRQPQSMRWYLELLRSECRVATEVALDPTRLRPADIACSTGDATLLHAQTGWTPRYAIAQTLRDTLDYWREQVAE